MPPAATRGKTTTPAEALMAVADCDDYGEFSRRNAMRDPCEIKPMAQARSRVFDGEGAHSLYDHVTSGTHLADIAAKQASVSR